MSPLRRSLPFLKCALENGITGRDAAPSRFLILTTSGSPSRRTGGGDVNSRSVAIYRGPFCLVPDTLKPQSVG